MRRVKNGISILDHTGHRWAPLAQVITWERLKTRDPKIHLKLLSFSLSGPLILRDTPHPLFESLWYSILMYMPSNVKCPVPPFETQVVPNKNTNMHDIGFGPSLVSSQASSIGCLLDVLVHYVLELATQPGSYSQEKLFQACFTWFLIEVNSNYWSASHYHDSISPQTQSYSSCYCDMISPMCPQQ